MDNQRIHVYVVGRDDRPSLRLQWLDPNTHKRKSKSIRETDEDEVEKARADLEYELNHGLHQDAGRTTWEAFRKLYLEERLAGRRKGTRAKVESVLDCFEETMNPQTLGKINERTVSRYAALLRQKEYKAPTIHGHLAHLRSSLKWAERQGLLARVPHFEMPKLPRKSTVRKITLEEFERLLVVAPNDDWRFFMLVAWYTGMRRNEMIELRWDEGDWPWVNLSARRINLPAEYTKADADQWIPISEALAPELESRKKTSGKLFTLCKWPENTSNKFVRLAKKAGLRISLHDLRRSFGSRYATLVPAQVLKELMRHSCISTTLKFYTNLEDQLHEAINKG